MIPAAVLGVHDAGRVVRRLQRVAAGQAPQRHAPHDPVHDVEFGVLRHRLMHRDRNVLALAVAVAGDQGGDDAGGELLAGDVVGVPDLRRDRRRVVFQVRIGIVAAIHHDAAQREMDQVGALEVRPWPVIAERRHPGGDQFGKARVQRGAVETERGVQRAAGGIEQDVGAFQQAQQLVRLRLDVQHDRFLVAVVVPEEQRAFRARLVVQERADAAGGVALGRLDLDHLGSRGRRAAARCIRRARRRFRSRAGRRACRDRRCPSSRRGRWIVRSLVVSSRASWIRAACAPASPAASR